MTPQETGAAPKGGPHDFAGQGSSPHQDTVAVQSSLDELRAYAAEFSDRARDTGLRAALANDAEYVERVLEWLYDLAPGVAVSADDVRREFGTSSAMGSMFRTAAYRRVIVHAGYTESKAVSRHGGTIRVWVRT